jgi:holliday junction DNA helicase RuvB
MARKREEELLEFAQNYSTLGRGLYVISIPPPFILTPTEDEPPTINPIEPQTFADFIGQAPVKEVLRIIIEAANRESRTVPNILLTGSYGHGKTTLAKLIAKQNNKSFKILDGASVGAELSLKKDTIYIIDEAHNIPAQVTDSFNILIDSNRLNIIACTTNPGSLSPPFRSRFRTIYLEPYIEKDIYNILRKASKRINFNITVSATKVIAERSKLNPRISLSVLEFVREIGVATKTKHPPKPINIKDALLALDKLGIDADGFNNLDRRYLEILSTDYPVGMQYITSLLSMDSATIQDEIEPYLLKRGIIQRTPKGRIKSKPNSVDIKREDQIDFTRGLSKRLEEMLGVS